MATVAKPTLSGGKWASGTWKTSQGKVGCADAAPKPKETSIQAKGKAVCIKRCKHGLGEGVSGDPFGTTAPYSYRFRGADRYASFTFPQSGFSITHDGRVCLSKIGSVKMVYHREIKGRVKTCTVSRCSTGKWYVCFSVECEPQRLPTSPEQVGIDVGLKTFATLSNAEEIANPRFFRQEEKALAKVQRKHAKLGKGTPERRKHRKAVARVHERIAFKRANFTHQKSRRLVDRYGVICVEDLHVNRMVHNHCLAKSISDAAWSAFFDQLVCKAEEAGRVVVNVNPAYTSQDCEPRVIIGKRCRSV